MATPSTVFLVSNTCWYLYNFRLPLLRELCQAGYRVAAVAPRDSYSSELELEGISVHHWMLARSSINPLLELRAIVDLIRIYQREQPDLVHHFTIKACLYGTIAAKVAPVYRVINAITGLGHVFLGQRKRTRLLRRSLKPLYRAVFMARRARVVFQNADDQEKLIQLGLTEPSLTLLIRSSGVDIEHFRPNEDSSGRFHSKLQLLFPSRLIREKGVQEVLEACRQLWNEGVPLDLLVAGDLDTGNRSSLSPSDLAALRAEPRLRCLGHVSDMRSLYAASDIVLLPSWREGLSRSLIEAAAMERPIITTDVPGCRDVVDHGVSGLLVPPRSGSAIALAIRLLLENPDLARRFGQEARRKVVDEFRVSLVNEHTLVQYAKLLALPIRPSRLPWRPRFS
jgi:glycosyltransferase involved in cell wall biosynthesis